MFLLLLTFPLLVLMQVLGQWTGQCLFRVEGLGFLFLGGAPTVGGTRPRRLLAQSVGLLAAYLVPVTFFALAWVGRGEPGNRLDVVADYPAARAGVLSNDRVVRINERPVTSFRELKEAVAGGQASEWELERGAEHVTVTVTPDDKGLVGVKPQPSDVVPVPAYRQLLAALMAPLSMMATVLSSTVAGAQWREVQGPVTIILSDRGAESPPLALIGANASGQLLWVGLLFAVNAVLVERRAKR